MGSCWAGSATAPGPWSYSDDLRYFGLASNITPSASAPLDPTRATLNAINSDEQLRAYLGGKHIVGSIRAGSEGLVSFLQNFWVRAILIAVFILGLFMRWFTRGSLCPRRSRFSRWWGWLRRHSWSAWPRGGRSPRSAPASR